MRIDLVPAVDFARRNSRRIVSHERSTPRSKFRWRSWAAALAVVVGLGFSWGADRTSSGPACGRDLTVPMTPAVAITTAAKTAESSRVLRLASFNIHSGVGRDGRFDLDRIAVQLAPFDFVALNEVRGPGLWSHATQGEVLARSTGHGWLWAPSEHHFGHDHFGNGLLSRVGIQSWCRMPLACSTGKGYRNAVLAVVPLGSSTVRVLATHVDRTHDRETQLQGLCDLFLSLASPAALMGDLNTTANDPILRHLLQAPGVVDALAGQGDAGRIDWIICRGLTCVRSGIADEGASDHPLVWADVEQALDPSDLGPASPRVRSAD